MPGVAFASNFLWVMVMGLLGPSLPGIVSELGISYGRAGLFFTLLSLGSLFGTSIGATLSDSAPRKLLIGGCALSLGIGLAVLGFMPSYALIALVVFLLSLLGSPIGAASQSVMLDMFPQRREKYLSLMTMCAAIGSFVAPLVVSLNYSLSVSWRWVFLEAAVLPIALFVIVLIAPMPRPTRARQARGVFAIARNGTVVGCAACIFLSVAVDMGFSYWLAEYFASVLRVSLRLSSAVVGIYLIGIMGSRALVPLALKSLRPKAILVGGLCVALVGIVLFLLIPSAAAKAALCALYGAGVGPLFPLLLARGSREYPSQPGAVSGLLFASLSLGGMAFPLIIGALASRVGLWRSYFFPAALVAGLLLVMVLWKDTRTRQERTT